MKPGEMYPRAVEIAEKRYKKAKDRYLRGLLERHPKRKNYVPPYDKESFEEKWWKMIPSEPSRTITAHLARDCYSHIHYDTQKRAITVREAARLQSFPDAFVFCGNMGNCYRQIGNAVPPLLAFSLAKHIKMLLARTNDSGVKHREATSRITAHA
jgi:DNA (cytosine-5)-methyltransferase 1